MRFSYIDSKGKEIEVDSVESLALRIEVGAIQPETEMYDAMADRWAPAEEHPVYRSLARGEEVTEEDIVPIGAGEEDTLTAAATAEAPPEPPAEPEAEAEPSEPEPAPGPEPEPEAPPEPEVAEPRAEETASPEAAAAPEAPPGGSGDDPLGLDFSVTRSEAAEDAEDAVEIEDLAPQEPEPGPAVTSGPPAPPLPEEEPPRDVEPAPADDDDLPYLEEEEPAVEEEAEEAEAPAGGFEDFGDVELEEPTTSGPPLPPEMEDAEAGGGSEEWAGAAAEADVWGDEGSADDGPPVLPEDDPDTKRLPAWARDAEPWEGGAASPSRVVRAEEQEAQMQREAQEGRRTAPRPAHWGADRLDATRKRRRRLQIAGVGVVALGILAGVAYMTGVGEVLGIGGGGNGEEEVPLSAEAVALKNAALSAAYAAAMDDVRADLADPEIPARPPEAWLQGIYFASAGEYPAVAAYWEAVAGTIEAARGRLASSFRGELRSQLDAGTGPSGRVAPGERERVEEEAMADWEATAPARDSVFNAFLALAGSSLELHVLLVEREDEIAYEPFSSPGVSRDPILEAVPDDPELNAEMNERLDAVFEAMSDTRVPRPITSEGILSLLVPALEGVGPGG